MSPFLLSDESEFFDPRALVKTSSSRRWKQESVNENRVRKHWLQRTVSASFFVAPTLPTLVRSFRVYFSSTNFGNRVLIVSNGPILAFTGRWGMFLDFV